MFHICIETVLHISGKLPDGGFSVHSEPLSPKPSQPSRILDLRTFLRIARSCTALAVDANEDALDLKNTSTICMSVSAVDLPASTHPTQHF